MSRSYFIGGEGMNAGSSDDAHRRAATTSTSERSNEPTSNNKPPVILELTQGTIHKRRASVSPPKAFSATFPSFSGNSASSDNHKRLRTEDTTEHNDGSAQVTPSTFEHSKYGKLNANSPHVKNETRSSSGSSTSTIRQVLLNKPSASPSPGMPNFKFSVFNALLSHTDILIQVIRSVSPRTLVYLYSISAPFHYIMNSHFTHFILNCIKSWAPEADWFFPWRCYRELCMTDPALRQPVTPVTGRSRGPTTPSSVSYTPMTGLQSLGDVNIVPTLRWLKMVTYREIVSREIVAWLAVGGHRTPVAPTIHAVKKLWFLMDIPVADARVSLIHNTRYFTNQTLSHLTMFFIKLDMFFTDPINYTGREYAMRECLLAEHTLTTLWDYLRGEDGTTRMDALLMFVKHGYVRPPRYGPETKEEQIANHAKAKQPIMGIPAHLVGRWGYERHGTGRKRLIRPDELVLREGIVRGMELETQYFRMIRWGFLDDNLQNMKPVKAEDVVLTLIKRKNQREYEAKKKAKEELENATKMDLDTDGVGRDFEAESGIQEPRNGDEVMQDAD